MSYIKDKNIFSSSLKKLHQTLQIIGVTLMICLPISLTLTASVVSAQPTPTSLTLFAAEGSDPKPVKNDCNGDNIRAGLPENDPNHCGILDYLVLGIQVLSGIVGVVVVAVIIFSGIQYSAAADDPAMLAAAKKRIMNAIIALLSFAFMYALLNYLVPGGVL